MDRTVTSGHRASASEDLLTDDAFLGGALQILQPRTGYRAGLDAVMLGACVPEPPAGGGMRVLDVGAGVGTAGLCLARRVPAAHVTLLEREPTLADLATQNVARNGLKSRVNVAQCEVGMPAAVLRTLGLAEEGYDHVIANPPFHTADAGTIAPDALKAGSHAMAGEELERWARFMARMAAPGGSVSVIHKADALSRLLAVLEPRFGALRTLPLYPRAHVPAHRIIVQGKKGSRAPLSMLPGLVLHASGDAFTPQAHAILHDGAALSAQP